MSLVAERLDTCAQCGRTIVSTLQGEPPTLTEAAPEPSRAAITAPPLPAYLTAPVPRQVRDKAQGYREPDNAWLEPDVV